jgi:hypothetical protein
MQFSPLALIKTHRKTSIAVSAVALYGAAGFLLLPWVAERQLSNVLQTRLGLQTRVESLYFNPFSFYLEIDGLELIDGEQGELLTLSHSHLNFQPSRLLLLKLQVAELIVEGVTIDAARYVDGSTTASVLAGRWQDSAEPSAGTAEAEPNDDSAGLPATEILVLSLTDIEIRVADAVPATPFSTTFTLNSFQLADFSTLENTSGNYTLAAEFEDSAPLTIDGDLAMVPLSTSGSLTLRQFPLPMLTRYGQDSLPFSLSSGGYSLNLDYRVDLAEAVAAINISNLNTGLVNVAALENGVISPFFSLTSLSLNGGQIELPQNTLSASALTLDGANISALINESGEVNFLRMLNQITANLEAQPSPTASSAAGSSAPNNDENSAPWQIDLTRFSLNELNLTVADASLELPFQLAALINGSVDSISNQAAAELPYTFTVDFESGGSLNSSGQLVVLPALALASSLTISQLNLTAIQPYLNEFASVVLESGSINLDTSLTLNSEEPFAVRGELAFSGLKVGDAIRNEDLVSLDRLAVDDFTLSLAANALEMSEVSVDGLYARVLINADSSTNIGRSVRAAAPDVTEPAVEPDINADQTSGAPMSITIGKVSINNAAANFTDRSLPLLFDANIQALNGNAEGLASSSEELATLNLEGQVNEFGLVQITSSLDPFNVTQSSEIDAQFTNIDMPALTPYVIKFAGREISEGSIDLGLMYKIQDGQLDANNQMVLKSLQLGDRVESPGAMDLPLDLALALLKDSNGVIDLNIPITGDINDPEFNFGPAIRSTLANVLTNIVAAPFRLLGSLIGGGDSSLESIRFLPGRSDIAPPEQQILIQLGEALTQRPQLVLEVPPLAAPEDTLALKTAKVNQQIETALKALAEADSLLTQRRMQVLEALYTASPSALPLIEIQQLHQQQAAEPTLFTPATTQLDVVAYNAEIRQRLVQGETISDEELNTLATARARAVVAFMTETVGTASGQIRVIDPASSSPDGDGWLVMEFGLGPAN